MSEKTKRQFEANVIGLPPLRLVLGNVPEPDPGDGRKPLRFFGEEKAEEARNTLTRLIGHLQDTQK